MNTENPTSLPGHSHSPDLELEIAYLADGQVNAPFILANAQVLLREGELSLALSLFRLVKDHKSLGYCAHFGIGQCFAAAKDWGRAIQAFEKALAISRESHIALALLQAYLADGQRSVVEKRAIELAREFREVSFLKEVRSLYQSLVQGVD